jgi:hypothetical protein
MLYLFWSLIKCAFLRRVDTINPYRLLSVILIAGALKRKKHRERCFFLFAHLCISHERSTHEQGSIIVKW